MMSRNLNRRLKQLEVRLAPPPKPPRTVIQFIDPRDHSVRSTLILENGRREWHPPRNHENGHSAAATMANMAGDGRL
jgi:hypothetical protein